MCELSINDGVIETRRPYEDANQLIKSIGGVEQHTFNIEQEIYRSWIVPLNAKFGEEQLRSIDDIRPRGTAYPQTLEDFVAYLGLYGVVWWEDGTYVNKATVDGDAHMVLSERLNEELRTHHGFLYPSISFCVRPYCSWDQTQSQKDSLTRLYRRLERSLTEQAVAV